MLRDEVKLIISAEKSDGEPLLNSPAFGAPLRTREEYPPRYGAQHRQDALWKGGNEALPPQWRQFKLVDGEMLYQDNSLPMDTRIQPLPGVRIDYSGQLVPGCEWYISPLGRSYFVNHNTRTTSWKKPTPERPPGSMMPECVVEGHSKVIRSLTYLATSCNIMSTSDDGSIRQWTRDGEPVGKPWNSDGGTVGSMTMSPDETLVVSGSADGRLRLWNVEKGTMIGDPWEGHDSTVRGLDWSPNAREIASGSYDGTIRRWNPDSGQQIAPPVETGHSWVYVVKYSPQGDTFTSGGADNMIRVWSKEGELLMEMKGHDRHVTMLCWSQDGAHIFSASYDDTLRKWQSIDGKELVIFRGHTRDVNSLCLSPDECHLVSASNDCSVRIWDLETNQQVGDPLLHDDELLAVAMSPDGKYIVSGGKDTKVYIWSMEAALKRQGDDHADESNAKRDTKLKGRPVRRPRDIFDGHLASKQQSNNRGLAKYGKDFWDTDTSPAPPRTVLPASPSSAPHWRNLLGSLRFSTRLTRISGRTVNVAAGRKKNRIAIAPPTAAELAKAAKAELAKAELAAAELAAATQDASREEAGSSTQLGQPAPRIQGSQGRPTETHGSSGGTGEVSYEVRCCGLFFSCGRPTSHQS